MTSRTLTAQRTALMMMIGMLTAALPGAAAGTADEPTHSWRDFAGVSNTSFTESSGDRAIQLSIDVPAPVHDVYTAFTTTEGFGSWAVPVTHVDLRVGGYMESSYDPNAKIGDPDNIRNQILAYVPDRLLVIRNVHAPMALADAELFQRTATAIEFVAIDAGHTRVTMTNAGYGAGEAFARLFHNFEWGDAYYLSELRGRFEHGPVDWAARAAQQKAKAASDTVTQAATTHK